jgi:basic membrane protein A
MKRVLSVFAVLVCLYSVMACKKSSSESTGKTESVNNGEGSTGAKDIKAVLLIPGTLGDRSFMDLAASSVPVIKQKTGIDVLVKEMGPDASVWIPTFEDYCEMGYSIIMSLSAADEQMNQTAKKFPDISFINICASSSDYNLPKNVYSVNFYPNEAALFGGVAAALKASEMGEDTLGFVGGLDIPGINYYLLGFIEGAKWVNPNIKVQASYAGSFNDPSKGKELATQLFNTGNISIIYACAGETGLGSIDAAREAGKFIIGVDVDQYENMKTDSPALAATIITSHLLKIPEVAADAVQRTLAGTLPFGQSVTVGIKEGFVGIAFNENYDKLLSKESRDRLAQMQKELLDNKLTYTNVLVNGQYIDYAIVQQIIGSVRP